MVGLEFQRKRRYKVRPVFPKRIGGKFLFFFLFLNVPKNVTSCISRKKKPKRKLVRQTVGLFPHKKYEKEKDMWIMRRENTILWKVLSGEGSKRIFSCAKKPTNKGDFSRYCLFFLALAVVSKLRRGGRRKREYKWNCRQRFFCLKPTFNLFRKELMKTNS